MEPKNGSIERFEERTSVAEKRFRAKEKTVPGKYAEKCILTGPTSLETECVKMGFGGEYGA